MRSNSLRHYRGIIQPNLEGYSSCLIGKFFLIFLAALIFVIWAIPWEHFYYFGWYQKLIMLMSEISPNIVEIPTTENQFPEYSIALIVFLNITAPFVAIYSFIYGIRYVKRNRRMINANVPTVVLIKLVFLTLVMLPMCVWQAYNFTGHTFYTPGLFLSSKPHFVAMMVGTWWFMNVIVFAFSCFSVLLCWGKRK